MSDVALMTAMTSPRMDEDVQTWVAALGEARGVGTTKAGALRDLADALDRREAAAARGDLTTHREVIESELDKMRYDDGGDA